MEATVNLAVLAVREMMRLMNHKGILTDDEYQLIMDSPVKDIQKIVDNIINTDGSAK